MECPRIADQYDNGWMVPDCLDDARRHVVISTHGWLVQTPRHTVIVDTAVGNGKTRAMAAFDHSAGTPWLERLAEAGVLPEAVDYVLHDPSAFGPYRLEHAPGRRALGADLPQRTLRDRARKRSRSG